MKTNDDVPELVNRGIFEFNTYGQIHDYYMAGKEEKKSVDKWLMDIKHPLVYEPGSMEDRYKAIIREMATKQGNLKAKPAPERIIK